MLIRKDVLELTVPVVTEQLFVMTLGVVNAMMASHIGKEAVSAIGMVDSINNIFIAFFSALAVGGTVVVAHYMGRKNSGDANAAARQALLSGISLSMLVTILIFLFKQPIIKVLYGSAEEAVLKNSFTYLNITLLTYPLISLTSISFGVLRGAGDTRTPMKVTIMMNIVNVALSYLFIYGINVRYLHLAVHMPGMGVMGAALGIATARISGAFAVLFILFRGSRLIKIGRIEKIKLDMNMQRSIFGIGLPASTESLMFNGGKLITQVFIVGMGTASVAANYVANSVFSLVNIPGSSLSIAATTLVGQNMGKGDSEKASSTLVYLVKLTSVCLAVLSAVSFPLARLLAGMYTQDSEIIDFAAVLIRMSAVTMPILWAVSFVLPAGLKGAGDAKYTMVTSMISMWAFRVVLGYVFGVPLKLGVAGVWMGMYADWLVRAVLYCIRLKGGKWKGNVVIKNVDEALQV